MAEYFKWGAPQALRWLWLLLPLGGLLWWAIVKRRAVAQMLVPVAAERRLALRPLRERLVLKALLLWLTTGLTVVAMARPQVGLHREKATRKGADVMLVLDTSLSMLARDLTPNRLEAMRRVAVTLVNRLPNDRFGVIVFAGQAHLYCPLTVDHDAVQMFVESVEAGASPTPGTALGQAVKLAGETLGESESQHRAMVILSDGEDHESGALPVADKIVRQTGIRIETMGFGTLEGEPIPLTDEQGNLIGLKKDSSGQTVVSKLGEDELKKLAAIGKGSYRRANERGAVEELAARLEALEGAQVGTTVYTEYGERFQWPLGAAIGLLVLEMLLGERRRERKSAGAREL